MSVYLVVADSKTMPHRLTALATAAFVLAAPIAAQAQTISNPDLFKKSAQVAAKAEEVWGVYDKPKELAHVAEIGYRVARQTGYTDMPFTFHLIDMPAPNAVALPGGQIFVTRGMLDLGLDDDMLAALLGHEMAHVVLHHQQKMQKKATLINVLSQALLVGVLISAKNSRTDYGGYQTRPWDPNDPTANEPTQGEVVQGAAAASIVLGQLLLRGYSREHEDEADENGQRWAAAAGFDPAGAQKLMALMSARLPQSQEYGYLQTHPFLADRMRAAEARGEYLKAQEPKPWEDFRQTTQTTLLTFADDTKGLEAPVKTLLENDALVAWPAGPAAEKIRLVRLHALRDKALGEKLVARDYGKVLRAYRRQVDEVSHLTPDSKLLGTLKEEIAKIEADRNKAYPEAVEVLAKGVYETSFLETFLSNWPDAPQAPNAALALGDAYSRLQQPTDAVTEYLTAWHTAPKSDEGRKAREGLKNLAPNLHELAALQKLADQSDDPELSKLAGTRLASESKTFSELRNGAEYLKRFPEGHYAGAVTERLNALAEKLYNEVVLYRAVGDDMQALDRIQKILTHAPLSPAAQQLRDQAVFEG